MMNKKYKFRWSRSVGVVSEVMKKCRKERRNGTMMIRVRPKM